MSEAAENGNQTKSIEVTMDVNKIRAWTVGDIEDWNTAHGGGDFPKQREILAGVISEWSLDMPVTAENIRNLTQGQFWEVCIALRDVINLSFLASAKARK